MYVVTTLRKNLNYVKNIKFFFCKSSIDVCTTKYMYTHICVHTCMYVYVCMLHLKQVFNWKMKKIITLELVVHTYMLCYVLPMVHVYICTYGTVRTRTTYYVLQIKSNKKNHFYNM